MVQTGKNKREDRLEYGNRHLQPLGSPCKNREECTAGGTREDHED